jgi:type IX secretion system PorP/SprF family membrane protein
MKKHIFIILLFSITSVGVIAQDRPSSSLYNIFTPAINPAANASYDRFTFAGRFNYQLIGYTGAPIFFNFAMIAPVAKSNFIFGAGVSHERIGARIRTDFDITGTYRVQLADAHYLNFGITGTFRFTEANYNSLIQNDPGDPLANKNSFQILSPDFKFGINYVTNNFFAGVTLGNLFTTKYSLGTAFTNLDPNEMHFYLHTGYSWVFHPNWVFQPSVLWKQVMGSPTQFDINGNFTYKNVFGFGVGYRTMETVMARLHVDISQRFKMGYAFNMGLGYRNDLGFHSHEIMLIYSAKNSKSKLELKNLY